jgi:ornithine carbamoyltransferase
MSARPRHFLDLDRLDRRTLRAILDRALAMKQARRAAAGRIVPDDPPLLAGRLLVMIFTRPSTRTRVSFEVAMRQLGGESMVLNAGDLQLGRGETIADTARVLSRYADAIMLRTGKADGLRELAEAATIPVINGLTLDSHPCQIMADVMTFEERRGAIKSRVVAWSGDGNNVASSWIHAAVGFGFSLRLACPPSLRPPARLIEWARAEGGDVSLTESAAEAVTGADCVVTDAWVSMGQEVGNRPALLKPYQVNRALMAKAKPEALFLHCLPAHRGEEVTDDVIDGPQSAVFDEAENRVHAQKAILAWCLAE